jgi:hypothetical protein
MRDVIIHTVFWAPAGYRFDGSPGAGALGYQALIEQFLADVAHDSGSATDLFSVLDQYGDDHGASTGTIRYDPAVDAITDTDPYPPQARQCPSPSGTITCVTDLELTRELDRVIGAGGRGLSNLWIILLPPNVDTCTQIAVCATNEYAGYHSEFSLGHGSTIDVVIPDPLVEQTPAPGSDPSGNPEAESTIDTIAHEVIEAITDPLGTAWMDPDGFEVADKCETGPQVGTPLGYAPDGSPYNQLIDGHEYLIQDVWSNAAAGCVPSSAVTTTSLPRASVALRQFSPQVSGDSGVAGRRRLVVELARAGTLVALAAGTTRADGSWGPLTLLGQDGAPHAVGDDRDQLEVDYGTAKGSPPPDLVQTGDGGNPFTESGYTGWFDLDHGYAVGSDQVLLAPCAQTGVLTLQVGARLAPSPVPLCGTESDAAIVPTGRLTLGTALTVSSLDNRAETSLAPNGALVRLTVSLGEPGSVSSVANSQLVFTPTGFPTCTAYLRIGAVRCSGLVPGARYRIAGGHARAGSAGAIFVSGVRLRGGERLALVNRSGRRLTTLHVAHLRVHIVGAQTVVASGTCQPGEYWGSPVSNPPTSSAVGLGIAGTGTICPGDGSARGLPTADIAQTDEFSGGQTVTDVPLIESTSPTQDATLYGRFVASAQSGMAGLHGSIGATGVPVSLTITPAGSRRRVFFAADVDTATGVAVGGLAPGGYVATWVLRDANGDTRTVTTRFVDEG